MRLNADDLSQLCNIAIEAAKAAGRYVSATRPTSVDHKDSGESLAAQVVTEVDRNSEARILEILAPTFAACDIALLTEESPDDGGRLVKDFFWCIDPIDGTLNFIEGKPGYAVSVALVSRAGVPHIGVVYDPVEHVTYHAIRGGGAFRNAMPWTMRPVSADASVTIFTDTSEAVRPSFEPLARSLNGTVGTSGGAVMNAIWCLENPPACYFKLSKVAPGGGCFWDFAATACIYEELGAWVSDQQGKPLSLNGADGVHLNHCGVLYATDSKLAARFLEVRASLNDTS